MQAVILCGVQGAGKSTFCRDRFGDTHVRINLDMLRTRSRERILVEACIAARQRFVVDNTNLTADDRRRYLEPAAAAGFEVVGYVFHSSLEEALAVNQRRPERERVIVKNVIGTFRRLEPPRLGEGFDALFSVRRDGAGGFVVEPWSGDAAHAPAAASPAGTDAPSA